MSFLAGLPREEPVIAVGLLEDVREAAFRLRGTFVDAAGRSFPEGDYTVRCARGVLEVKGPRSTEAETLRLTPKDPGRDRFSLEATVGLSFHWEEKEQQSFRGGLRLAGSGFERFHVINDVALETYIASVICSEMDASSPLELIKAHSVISRSWLLAQRAGPPRDGEAAPSASGAEGEDEWIRFYDREAHAAFDVCADDHCQRYHGVERVRSETARRAVGGTRGRVLAFSGAICDTRYSKCCGGVTEDSRVAWADVAVPYLVPVLDGPGGDDRLPLLNEEQALRRYLEAPPPDVYCNCSEERLLSAVLTARDRRTKDFFRWSVTLSAARAGELVVGKLGRDLGRILRLEPVERGRSGRLKRLRIVGEAGSLVVGNELEIRRVLSPTHLYSSAFVVDTEGPTARPDGFTLRGAGWGHGVGLCQIGAAVMAWHGAGYEDILAHYYRGAGVESVYP